MISEIYLLAVLLLLLMAWRRSRPRSALDGLPGPRGLPVLGNALQLAPHMPYLKLAEWAKTYGPVFKINLVGRSYVIVAGKEEIYEALVTKDLAFAGRPPSFMFDALTAGSRDAIISDYTPRFIKVKKIIARQLRGYGAGLKRIEDITTAETDHMIRRLQGGQPVLFKREIQKCLARLTYQINFGKKLTDSKEEEIIIHVAHMMNRLFALAPMDRAHDYFPWLRHLNLQHWKDTQIFCALRDKQYKKWRDAALETNDEDEWKVNIIRHMYNIIEGENEEGLNDIDVMNVSWQIMITGILTSSSNLCALTNILSYFPRIQHKLHEEIDRVVGDGQVTLDVKREMHYTNAVIYEMLRYMTIGPLAVPHMTRQSVTLGSYKIPSGTVIWPHLWQVAHDEAFWGDPFHFRPERFLDEAGQLVLADHPTRQRVLTFGAGRRVCSGETFAMNRLFVILVKLMQSFNILPETTTENQPTFDCRQVERGIIVFPPDFKVRFISRKVL